MSDMTATTHTPEPWHDAMHGQVDAAYGTICQASWVPNARRIVAAVNACAGIDTELLEANPAQIVEVVGVAVLEQKQKLDDLISRLTAICDEVDQYDDHDGETVHISYATIALTRDALRRLKGKVTA